MTVRFVSICTILCAFLLHYSEQTSSSEDPFYVAGVVEYHRELYAEPDAGLINTDRYIEIVNLEQAREADIIVFPEATLSEVSIHVPSPADKVVPCGHSTGDLNEILIKISCAASSTKKYIVINLTEKSQCTKESQAALNDTRPCSSSGNNIYNTNVVFDRNGEIIARYRKYNLFGEPDTNTTVKPEVSTFTADFGVTFGLFTCFDIAFDKPARDLVALGITDIIYPVLWHSELPFLTALQVQLSWAYKMNVNLLAAGGNKPEVGNTGTGIFNGRNGALVGAMHFENVTKLYVAKVPKINGLESGVKQEHSELASTLVHTNTTDTLNLKLYRDSLELFNTEPLDLTQNVIFKRICYDDACCSMEITLIHKLELAENQMAYKYRAVIFDGVRSFYGNVTTGIAACGIVACTDDNLASCGERFNETRNVVEEAVQFTSIKIEGVFRGGSHIMMLPSALNVGIMPLTVEYFNYEESSDYFGLDGKLWRNATIELVKRHSGLLTFGIWGRDFNKDGSNASAPYVLS